MISCSEKKKSLDDFCCDATMQSRFHGDYRHKTPFSVFSQENKTALKDFNMVINMALRPNHWLVWGFCRLKLGECVVIHRDAGSACARRRVCAPCASPQFGNVPGTNCNFDEALPRDNQDNQNILLPEMPFLNRWMHSSVPFHVVHACAPLLCLVATSYWGQCLY